MLPLLRNGQVCSGYLTPSGAGPLPGCLRPCPALIDRWRYRELDAEQTRSNIAWWGAGDGFGVLSPAPKAQR